MKDELSEAEKKNLDKKEKEKEKEKENGQKQEPEVVKKSVFAKLKNYNTASTRAPNEMKQKTQQQQNSNRPNAKSNVTINNDSNIIVKEKANRYSNEGKFANFSFLKKIDKKTVDKRYKMSFADFKKL